MSEVVTLKLRLLDEQGGSVQDLRVAALLEVDGKSYQAPDDYAELRDILAHLAGRVDTIQDLLRLPAQETSSG